MPIMKRSYRNKPAGPHPANSMLGLLSLGIAVAALAIAIVALVRTQQVRPHEHDARPDPAHVAANATADPETTKRDAPPPQDTADQPSLAKADDPYVAANGRSPIPQAGETIDKPLPAKTLDIPPDGVPAPEDAVVPWDQAAKHLGHDVTVEGKIVDTHLLESGSICFLNFHEDFRDKFYIAMFREAFEGLPQPPDDYYLGKTIRITGLVKTHKGRPQIEVHSRDQIEVVNGS
jgi:hypothetical protein